MSEFIVFLPDNKTKESVEGCKTAIEVLNFVCKDVCKLEDEEDCKKFLEVFALWIRWEHPPFEKINDGNGSGEKTMIKNHLYLQLNDDNKLEDSKNKLEKFLVEQDEENTSNITFRLGRNVHFSVNDEEDIKNPIFLKLLYQDACNHVVRGLYPFPPEEWVELAHIKLEINQEEYVKEKMELADVVRMACKTLPSTYSLNRMQRNFQLKMHARKYVTNKSSNVTYDRNDDQVLMGNHDPPTEKQMVNLYLKYLRKCRTVPCYGALFFGGQMERSFKQSILDSQYKDKIVSIAINRNGLHVVDVEGQKIVHSIEFDNLSYGIIMPKNKSHHQGLFFKTQKNKTRQIFTRHASFINKTLIQYRRAYQSEESC